MESYDIDLGFAHCQVATWCFLTWKQTWVSKVDEPVRHLEFATRWSNGDHGATLARRKASHIFLVFIQMEEMLIRQKFAGSRQDHQKFWRS